MCNPKITTKECYILVFGFWFLVFVKRKNVIPLTRLLIGDIRRLICRFDEYSFVKILHVLVFGSLVFGIGFSAFSFGTLPVLAGGGDGAGGIGSNPPPSSGSSGLPTTNGTMVGSSTGSSGLGGTAPPITYNSSPSSYPNNGSSTVLGNNNLSIGTYNNTQGLNNVQCGLTGFATASGQTQSVFANPQTSQTNLVGQVGVSWSQQKCTNVNKGIKDQEYGASLRNAMNNNSVENTERIKACTTLLLNKLTPPTGFCERLPTHELLEMSRERK
jgi:hypothetical protein